MNAEIKVTLSEEMLQGLCTRSNVAHRQLQLSLVQDKHCDNKII